MIPRTINFVWLGAALPEKYAQNIIGVGAAGGSQYQVTVWCERQYQPRTAARLLISRRVQVAAIDQCWAEAQAAGLAPQLVSDLQRIVATESVGAANFAVGSDLLRQLILYLRGGYYFDTDVTVDPPLTRLDDSSHRGLDFVLAPIPPDWELGNIKIPRRAFDPSPVKYKGWGTPLKMKMSRPDWWAMGATPRHHLLEASLTRFAARYRDKLWTGSEWSGMQNKRFQQRLTFGLEALTIGLADDFLASPQSLSTLRSVLSRLFLHSTSRRLPDEDIFFRMNPNRCSRQNHVISLQMGIAHHYDNSWKKLTTPRAYDELGPTGRNRR